MNMFEITEQNVLNGLLALERHSSAGPDRLHPFLLKACAQELARPLCLIFNKSLASGDVPSAWKKSLVTPLYKGKSRLSPANYRPVSLTSVPCKVMERIIAANLMTFLEENNILSRFQYGFRAGRSTEDQLLLTYCFVSDQTDGDYIVDMILLDFSKAFDVICHSILLMMLEALGVPATIVTWIAAFLQSRQMSVACSGAVSGPRAVLSGVPQGSVLGPILFLIYVNYITAGISCNFSSFADDFKLYLHFSKKGESLVNGVQSLQADLDSVNRISASWNLKLNQDKCVVMRFRRGQCVDPGEQNVTYHLDGVQLKFVSSAKDLGVHLDAKLRFHHHIRTMVNRAAALAQNLLRSTVNRSPDFMVKLFVSHVRPMLDYCSCLWNVGYLLDSRLIESVQRRWTAQIEGLSNMSYNERLQFLGLYSLRGRRLRADLIKYFKILHFSRNISDRIFTRAPDGPTRGHSFKLLMPRFKSDMKGRFFHVRCIRAWNALPAQVVEAGSLEQFKKLLCAHLGNQLYAFD